MAGCPNCVTCLLLCFRLLPEVLTFLRGALLTAVPGGKDDHTPAVVFPISEPHAHMLLIGKVSGSVGLGKLAACSTKKPLEDYRPALFRNIH